MTFPTCCFLQIWGKPLDVSDTCTHVPYVPTFRKLVQHSNNDYWTFIENPTYDIFENIFENLIYDVSSKGSVYSETYESCKEEQLEFSYDRSELYLSICNKDLKKKCSEESNGIQLVEVLSQPSSSHIDVPYVLEQLGAYTTSYYLISLDDQHHGVVDLLHHLYLYINAI